MFKKPKKKVNLSIIIVYYGELDRLIKLLSSIKENDIRHPYEIIVVNNKQDEDIKSKVVGIFNNAIYIKSKTNIGYGRGNNLGVKKASGKYIFIVNPDTKIIKGSIDSLVDFLEKNKEAAIVAPNLVDTSGKLFEKQGTRMLTPMRGIFSLTILSRLLPNNNFFTDYYMMDVNKNTLREVGVVPGSAFLIRKRVFDDLNGFDKNFFLYFEEMDLCKRVKDAGSRIYMTPLVIMEHDWGPNEGNKYLNMIFRQSRFYYFRKHFGTLSAILMEFLAGISVRLILVFFVFFAFAILGFMLWN
jgi:GT2 family glycosyltransferase